MKITKITKRYLCSHIKWGVVATMLCLLCVAGDLNAKDIFAELAGMPQMESTYVSGRFAHSAKKWHSRDGKHGMDLSRGFSAMYTYQCYTTESVTKAKKLLKEYLDKNPDVELVMRSTNPTQDYRVYEKFMDDGKLQQLVIWNCDAPNVCEIVVVDWKKGLVRGEETYSDESR